MIKLGYIRAGKSNRALWVVIYALVTLAVVLVAYSLASNIRTRYLPSGKAVLTVPYSKYLVGEEITFKITNSYNSTIYVSNNCPTEPLDVYRYDADRWVRVHDTASIKDCSDENRQIAIPANGSVTGSFSPWHNLFKTPGKYRVVAFVDYYNALPFQDFEVIEKPVVPQVVATASAANQATQSTANRSTSTATSSPKTTTPATPTRQRKTITISVGTVVVEYDNATIYVLSVSPSPGYTYEKNRNGNPVEITFQGGGNETQLLLSLVNGQVVSKVITGGGD